MSHNRTQAMVACAVLALLMLAAGCLSLPRNSSAPSAKVISISKDNGSNARKTTAPVLEAEIMRYADELTALLAQAADSFGDQVGTPEARALALRLKVGAANNSMIIAAGPNPTANLLDMVVLVQLWRMSLESYWVPRYGPPAQAVLDVSLGLENEIWSVAGGVLTPPQQSELRNLIATWHAQHPEQVDVGIRFRDFAEIAASKDTGSKTSPSSVFSLFFLDPFAGLDPATREMQQTRYVADRALYVLQRMPNLLRWQSELLLSQTLATPDLQQMLSNSTRFATSAEQLSEAVQNLPEQMSVERQKLMTDFVGQMPQWQALLTQLHETLVAGNEMAASVNAATKSLDTFVGRYDSGHVPHTTTPSSIPATTNGSDTNPAATASSPTGKPFDVTEYGAAAAQIAGAAQQLNTLVDSLDKSTPQLSTVVERAGMSGRELVDYAFHRALWLLVFALIGVLLIVLLHRWMLARSARKTPTN